MRVGPKGPAADVDDEFVERLAHPGLAGAVAPAAAAEAAAGLRPEASSRPRTAAAVTGPDVEPDVLATAVAVDVGQRVEVIAAAERGRTFASAPGDLVVARG